MGYRVSAAPLLPLLYVQGRRAQRATPLLPEPPGDRVGGRWDESADSQERALRLLVLGDSAAAGVGAPSQDAALLGQLVSALAPAGPIAWRLVARTGATAAGTRRHLAAKPAEQCDVAVVSIGTNDIMAGRGTDAVLADLHAIVNTLQQSWGVRHVVLSGMPPIGRIPALPQPLRWYMGRKARALDAALLAWVAGQPGCEVLTTDWPFDKTELAADGFHPGPTMYAVWGRAAAERVRAWQRSEQMT